MKNIIFFTLSFFVLSFGSCTKDKIKLKNITQTDENGNIIGEPNPEHWNIQNFDPVSADDLEIIFNAELSIKDDLAHSGINLDLFNLNCSSPNFAFTIFPNPVNLQETENKIYFNLETDLDIMTHYFAVVANDKIITSSQGSQVLEDFFYPDYGKDFTLYYVFLTTDSCAFYGKGDIITK